MKIVSLLGVLIVAVCACTPIISEIPLGGELPNPAFDICTLHNRMGNCIQWKFGSGKCLSLESEPGRPVVVACDDLKKVEKTSSPNNTSR